MDYVHDFESRIAELSPGLKRLELEAIADQPLAQLFIRMQHDLQGFIDTCRWQRQTISLGTMPHVHLDYIDDANVNAFAFSGKDCMFIGINWGTLTTLYHLFDSMMSDSRTLPSIGDTTDDRVGFVFDGSIYASSKPELIPPDARRISPCPIRRDHARILFDMAIYFLVGHELAHIRNGHVDYMNSLLGTPFVVEISPKSVGCKIGLTRQVIEMDADSWGAVQGVTLALHSARVGPNMPTYWKDAPNPMEEVIYSWFFAVHTILLLFAGKHIPLNDYEANYPPPRLCQTLITGTVFSLVLRGDIEISQERFFEIVGEATVFAEAAFSVTEQRPWAIDDYREAFSPLGTEHSDAILRHYAQEVREELIKFSHATDLPPAKQSN